MKLSASLRHVSETLVPQFADHCSIDLFHGDKLIRRAQVNADGWTPPPGSWARVGEQVRDPEAPSSQQAMTRLDAILAENLEDIRPAKAPNQRSLEAAEQVGMHSVV